ncbi:hypothetical protein [Streptomyces rimosus]|nr:hypothetical protein [Streptomyces rimosus]
MSPHHHAEHQERRAYLVAVRHSTTFDDPFGDAQTFRPRSWADLVD